MDIVRFHNAHGATKMEQGEIVNHLTSKMWIERYRDAGEFTLVGPVDKRLRETLPLGCFITHLRSSEIMIVENHEINETQDNVPQLTITGRSLETYLENRIIGSNKVFPAIGEVSQVADLIEPNFTWNQAVALINKYIDASALTDDNLSLPYIVVSASVVGDGVNIGRSFDRGTVYDALIPLLEIDNLGIKCIRPSVADPNVNMIIHKGTDRSHTVSYSFDKGEIINADYLWTNKKLKTCAMVTGKWVEIVVNKTSDANYFKRMIYVDGTDIDSDLEEVPTSITTPTLDQVIDSMEKKGLDQLASLNNVAITKAEASKQHTKPRFRIDFDLGDIVTVHGDYNENASMRVTEYVEYEDENSSGEYPTFSILGDESIV